MKRNTFIKGILGLPILSLFSFKQAAVIKQNPVVEFTPDILKKHNFGLYIINIKANVVENPNYAATVSWKLGYHLDIVESTNNIESKRLRLRHNKYFMSNFLTDGWATPIGDNYEEICEYLNNHHYGEKFRIMTKEELFYLIENRTNWEQLVR